MSSNWESLQPENDPGIDDQTRSRFLGAWNEHREVYGYTLLAELPYALLTTLREHPDTKGIDYDLIVVDEYQDLNACDLALLKHLANHGCSIIAGGDDDQSIYSFRRAAPEGIRRFTQDYPEAATYPLSMTQRCGSRIIEWANYVIVGDPDRPRDRALLQCPQEAEPGEVGLLAFSNQSTEADGIATLVNNLVNREQNPVPAREILILLRGDNNGAFSGPIKERLTALSIPVSDPEAIDAILARPSNRWLLELLRLLVDREDSIAWASLIELTAGIGDAFVESIYARAHAGRLRFGAALLAAHGEGFPDAPAVSRRRALELVAAVTKWLDEHPLPFDPETQQQPAWGNWIIQTIVGDDPTVPPPDDELKALLLKLDSLVEPDTILARYLAQIRPLGRDLAMAESAGVRIMSMASAKGLTVQATIVAALEQGIMPRPDADLAEERRLLYVAMTRSRRFLFGTWARRRTGPTARSGAPRVRMMRSPTSFLQNGPVTTVDGASYLRTRWP